MHIHVIHKLKETTALKKLLKMSHKHD